MKEAQMNNVIRIRIIELSSKYEHIPVPIFEFEMNAILKEIEYLESLIN